MNPIRPSSVVSALVVAAASSLGAQDLPFESGSTGADGAFTVDIPTGITGRATHSAAFDAARGEVIVMGGWFYTSFPTAANLGQRNDTVAWDGNAWTTRENGSPPQGLSNYGSMAFDAAAGKIVFYTGRTTAGSYNDFTYTWDGSSWTTRNTQSAPGTLGLHAMAYDAVNEEVILFGGYNGSAAVDRTFAWDDAAGNWVNKAPATSPGARYYHAMCWDAAREEIVLFGGYSGGFLNDTWTWDPATSSWKEESPANRPPPTYVHAVGYDPATQKVVLFGGLSTSPDGNSRVSSETWTWDGDDWTRVDTARMLPRRNHAMVTDEARGELLMIGGQTYEYGMEGDTWRWDGTAGKWVQAAGDRILIDMNEKPDGVWNFTSVEVPASRTVAFLPNDANTGVTWLATDDILIDGVVSVNGTTGFVRPNNTGDEAPGGPGGFAGGLGGRRPEIFNTVSGTPGQGPAGGAPGVTVNQAGGPGQHQGVYGNPYVIPPVGGSGGGGAAASSANVNGGNGGGGGGVFVAVSSADIILNGRIEANGGYYGRNASHNGPLGGHGAGGAIKLVADRIDGNGRLETLNGAGVSGSNLGGYVRLESYLRPFDIAGSVATGQRSNAAPVIGVEYNNPPMLVISSVAGSNVAQPPSGSFNAPDVIFSEPGEITVVATATNIPDGTPVTLRVTTPSAVITLPAAEDPAVPLTGGTATFTLTVPAGFGTLQAFATFDVDTSTL